MGAESARAGRSSTCDTSSSPVRHVPSRAALKSIPTTRRVGSHRGAASQHATPQMEASYAAAS
eukprot:2010300-Prymnesium_polylepis.1